MTPGSNRDLYGESRLLAQALRARGESEAARRINDAIEGGSTSSEILYRLRWEFDRLIDRGTAGDPELCASIADLRDAVDKTLG